MKEVIPQEVASMVASIELKTKEAIEDFGEYNFTDKGPHEVMDIESICKDLRKMAPEMAAQAILEVSNSENIQKGLGRNVAESLVGSMDDWDDLFDIDGIADLY